MSEASDSEKPILPARAGFWMIIAIVFAGSIFTVRWEHPMAGMIAAGFAVLSVNSLLLAAWLAGRQGGGSKTPSALLNGIDGSADGIAVTDSEGAFDYSNPSFHRLLSFAAGARADRRVVSLTAVSEELGDVDRDAFERLVAGTRNGAGGHVEFSVGRPDGSTEWRRLTAVPLATGKRAFSGTLWWVEDVTVQRELESVRHDEEARLSDMLDLLPVGFFSADGEGVIQYANQALARWLGIAPDRLVGRPFADFVADVGDGEDLVLKDAEGRTFAVALEQSQRDDTDGDIAYTRSVVLRDIVWSELPAKMAEDHGDAAAAQAAAPPASTALPRSAEPLHWLFADAPVGIVLLDLNGGVTDCNQAFLALTGAAKEMIVGRPFAECLAREDRGDLSSALSKIVMGIARGTQMEIRLPGPGGREIVRALYASRIAGPEGEATGLVIHLIDATEQKNLEVQFSQSQKMEAVGQLAGGVAHDFNNLLTAMIGFCDLLLARHGPDDPSFNDIQQIRQNANRATNLVRQLLAFSRKQTLQPVEFDVVEAMNDLANLLRRLIGETVELTIEQADDVPLITADRGQFDQVIINLTVNARDAMPGGGAVTIRTSRASVDASVQRGHDLMPAGTYALVEVIDTGVGIPKENLERIFEPFFSTKEVGSGTGLGLSTVYGIVHQSDGFVFVDSAPGEGTTFSIYLPERVDEAGRAAERSAETEAAVVHKAAVDADLTGNGTVLLVEDEDAVRMFGARALRNKGYTVLEAEDGEGALDVINESEGRIDLIVSDVVMPGMDGHTLVNLVRHEVPDVKVILMSGYAEDVFRDQIERDDTIHFLGKPFTLKDLAGKVKEVIEG